MINCKIQIFFVLSGVFVQPWTRFRTGQFHLSLAIRLLLKLIAYFGLSEPLFEEASDPDSLRIYPRIHRAIKTELQI